jgi:hypothetical protein
MNQERSRVAQPTAQDVEGVCDPPLFRSGSQLPAKGPLSRRWYEDRPPGLLVCIAGAGDLNAPAEDSTVVNIS